MFPDPLSRETSKMLRKCECFWLVLPSHQPKSAKFPDKFPNGRELVTRGQVYTDYIRHHPVPQIRLRPEIDDKGPHFLRAFQLSGLTETGLLDAECSASLAYVT